MRTRVAINGLIGRRAAADKGYVNGTREDSYRSWLIGELVLAAVLAAGTAVLVVVSGLHNDPQPPARLAADTAVAVVAAIVAVLGLVRFQVEGRALDLLLAAGFGLVAAGTIAFELTPLLGADLPSAAEAWSSLAVDLAAATLIAVAAFVSPRLAHRHRALAATGAGIVAAVALAWAAGRVAAAALPLVDAEGGRAPGPALAYAALALLSLAAAVGFGLRFRRHGRDLDRWLALALTLVVFADLHYVLAASPYLLYNDFLRLLAYAVLLVGVWRAYGYAEFGRAVAEERARVAREIHDGLAQYLFAISAHVSMLEAGADLDEALPRLRRAAEAAQQEARFAVLALSSASGTAPFDAALRRYVEFLTGDGRLDVELDIDPDVRLAPDEQIEIFRIVQEGLANARHHAGAGRAEVTIAHRGGPASGRRLGRRRRLRERGRRRRAGTAQHAPPRSIRSTAASRSAPPRAPGRRSKSCSDRCSAERRRGGSRRPVGESHRALARHWPRSSNFFSWPRSSTASPGPRSSNCFSCAEVLVPVAFDIRLAVADVFLGLVARSRFFSPRSSSCARRSRFLLGVARFCGSSTRRTGHRKSSRGRFHFTRRPAILAIMSGTGRTSEALRAIGAVAANRDLRRLQLANVGSVLGNWAYLVALLVYAFDAGGAGAVALVTVLRMIPAALVGPFTSVLGDRLGRRTVMVGSDILRAGLMLAAGAVIAAGGPVWVVFTIVTLSQIVSTAFTPAYQAILPGLARTPEELAAANVATSVIISVGAVVGPAIGAGVLAVSSISAVFAFNAASFVWSALLVLAVREPEHAGVVRRARNPLGRDAAAGLTTIAANRDLRFLTSLYVVQALVGGAMNVFVVITAIERHRAPVIPPSGRSTRRKGSAASSAESSCSHSSAAGAWPEISGSDLLSTAGRWP